MKILTYLFTILFLCGCSPREKASGTPQKILSLSAAATKILFDLDVPPSAIDEYGLIASGNPPPQVIGKGSAISREKMVELGIDYVILWDYQQDSASQFRKNGLQVLELKPFRLADYPALILKLGKITGKTEKAESLVLDFQKKLSSFEIPEKRKPVYFELYGSMKSAGNESYTGDLIARSGGVFLNRKTGLLSTEKLLEHQPEVIFYVEGFTTAEEIRNRSGFSELPAVKNNRIYSVPRRLFTEGIAPLEAMEFFKKYLTAE